MDSTKYTVTLQEFRLFHGIDRALFVILVTELGRLPSECLYILGLWLWLERALHQQGLATSHVLDRCLLNQRKSPLTHIPVQKDISLQFFQENRFTTFREIQNLVRGVCMPTLSDIWLKGASAFRNNSTRAPTMGTACASSSNLAWACCSSPDHGDHLCFVFEPGVGSPAPVQQNTVLSRPQNQEMFWYEVPQSYGGRPWNPEMSPEERVRNERTMFMTFFKGYLVSEDEIRLFFVNYLGDCRVVLHAGGEGRRTGSLCTHCLALSSAVHHSSTRFSGESRGPWSNLSSRVNTSG